MLDVDSSRIDKLTIHGSRTADSVSTPVLIFPAELIITCSVWTLNLVSQKLKYYQQSLVSFTLLTWAELTMTFVCIVCRELLTNHPHNDVVSVGGAAGGSRPKVTIDIVSTKCGHMYHLICLNDWFNKQKNPRQECPYCKSAVMSRDYQRIFPIGDEETDEIESRLQKAKEVQIESASLKNEIQQFASILEETGTQLQDKTLALDILQYEFNQKLDEATKHKDENKQLKEAVQMLQMQLTSLQETHGKEKLGWDRKVGEVTREMALLRAEIEEQKRKPRPD
ncbi:unnamed protein product, partial [Allacma fusca]